ncbi:unnamed protein product [Withania somnifera]
MKCYGFFDFSCHIQYICISWVVMFDKHVSRWKHSCDADSLGIHRKRSHKNELRHHKKHAHRRHTRFRNDPRRENLLGETDYHYYRHHVHKDKHKHGKTKSSCITKPLHSTKGEDDHMRHHRQIKFLLS